MDHVTAADAKAALRPLVPPSLADPVLDNAAELLPYIYLSMTIATCIILHRKGRGSGWAVALLVLYAAFVSAQESPRLLALISAWIDALIVAFVFLVAFTLTFAVACLARGGDQIADEEEEAFHAISSRSLSL